MKGTHSVSGLGPQGFFVLQDALPKFGVLAAVQSEDPIDVLAAFYPFIRGMWWVGPPALLRPNGSVTLLPTASFASY